MYKQEQIWGLILFPLVYVLVYGSLHLFIYWKIKSVFALGPAGGGYLVLFLVLMVLAPVLERVSDRTRWEWLARVLAFVGYAWMGMLFLSLTVYLALGGYRVFVAVLERVGFSWGRELILTDRHAVWTSAAVAAGIAAYGLFEARWMRIEHLVIRSAKIPAAAGRVRVVQISDVHLGLIVRHARLRRIVKAVRRAEPDILVSTGDLVDGELSELDSLVQALAEVKPKHGKYAVTGNHEFYAGIQQAANFTNKAGFTLLRGESAAPGGLINIAGVDDVDGKYFDQYRDVSEAELLSRLSADKFTLLLKHRPKLNPEALGRFDLQLSGHTHHGQIFPFTLFTRLTFPLGSGYVRLREKAALYTSRGTGTWGPPFRFLAAPEVTVIDLVAGEPGPSPRAGHVNK